MNKRPTISSAHIHVNVEKLRKIEGYELIRFQLVGESKVRLPQ
jgi:hypothetical protein